MALEPTEIEGEGGPVIKPFAEFLIHHQKGMTAHELGEAMHEVVEAVTATGKQGKVSLVVTIDTMKDTMDTLIVKTEVKKTVPVEKPLGSVYFKDDDGNLTRSNPQQPDLGLREVGGPKIASDDAIEAKVSEVGK